MDIEIKLDEKYENPKINNTMPCLLCPHKCGINRNMAYGRCKAGNKIEIGGYSLHKFEEPCISGEHGSGTVFFSKCNMNCVFCQNYEISNLGNGKKIEIADLVKIFLEQQAKGAENINLVSPTIYADKIAEAVIQAKKCGLKLPIIYNSNGYENVETLKLLNGIVDVYLPDLKYFYNDLGKKYSKVKNYFEIATTAIKEMYNQVGSPIFDENGMIKKGLIIRHLVLPNNLENTRQVLKWIKENISHKVYISIMAQYFPAYNAKDYTEINRKLTFDEYLEVEDFLDEFDFENGYMQDFSEEDETQYVPKWTCQI